METELTLEYGKKLKTKKIIHQELLCCQSEKAASIFKDAQPLRAAYAAINDLRKNLKELVCPRVTKEDFDDQNLEVKVGKPRDHLSTKRRREVRQPMCAYPLTTF
jgi:hypothetical protein